MEIDSWDGRGDGGVNAGAESIVIDVAGETIEIPLDFSWNAERASGTSGDVSWSLSTNDVSNRNAMFGSYNDQTHTVQITVNNPTSEIDLNITSSLDQSISDESFGIDNVRVSNFDNDGNQMLTANED